MAKLRATRNLSCLADDDAVQRVFDTPATQQLKASQIAWLGMSVAAALKFLHANTHAKPTLMLSHVITMIA